jgi:hypothetical protein
MRANFIHIEPFVRHVFTPPFDVPGDIAEFGVWHGTTFLPMAELARRHGRCLHAVDSFRGMAAPGALDGDGYPQGDLSVGGPAVFRELVAPYGPTVLVHEGFVPEILGEMAACRFAFVHVDLDHYNPTLDSLRFVWPRLAPGGIVAVHDFYPNSDLLASGAVKNWCAETGERPRGPTDGRHAWFQKGQSA